MSVAELIDELQKYPAHWPVMIKAQVDFDGKLGLIDKPVRYLDTNSDSGRGTYVVPMP
jgi:hypothetical protein